MLFSGHELEIINCWRQESLYAWKLNDASYPPIIDYVLKKGSLKSTVFMIAEHKWKRSLKWMKMRWVRILASGEW